MCLSYKALFLDLSGVLYNGNIVIEGAIDAVQKAHELGLELRLVTNTATQSSSDIIAKLLDMGFSVHEEELFTAPVAAKYYLEKQKLRPYCLVHDAIKDEFSSINQSNPNCVLLGDAREGLKYETLNYAFQLCKQGAPLIGIGMNKYFKDDNTLKLDAGAFIHAIQWAADIEATIMGKPSKEFFDEVVASTSYSSKECLMVGDDLNGDIIGAINAGMQATLVRTGKYMRSDENRLPQQASVIDSIANLFN